MNILVYVEGPSDRIGLEALLRRLIELGRDRRVGVTFFPLNGKSPVLNDSPRKAVRHLLEHEIDWVFALPDLYPMSPYNGTANQHRSFAELVALLRTRFVQEATKNRLAPSLHNRFRVHCLKHDLEVLLLAARDQLRARLKTQHALHSRWRLPVEDQNDRQPPKRIVEDLFNQYRRKPKYVDTLDAPWILERADLRAVLVGCPQNMTPFVTELDTLINGGTLP